MLIALPSCSEYSRISCYLLLWLTAVAHLARFIIQNTDRKVFSELECLGTGNVIQML
jgi:hypothetical protein